MKTIITLLDKVKSSGAFSASGTLPSTPPGLTVEGVGQIGLPLTEHQAQAIIKRSEQSPFGRREETIVDTDVRKSWQISADDFELTNPQWTEVMQTAVDQIGNELGLSGCKIGFEQYKLLVYEEGSFFASHRDTEKIPNMFATMVVNLPSEHEGGELIVSHAGQSQSYSFADSSLFEPSFVAFYADCYHEVKPITAGYRLSLIYNLSITNRKKQPDLGQQFDVIADIEQALQSWTQEQHELPILTYLLEHSYSEQNLSLSNLKHGDFAKASVLLNAAANSGCQAYLCLATYHQESYGEAGGYGYGRYSDHDLDESDFEEYDVGDEEVYAHAFVAADGSTIRVNKLNLDEDALLAKKSLKDGPGRDVSISEATGNEGATKDLWYHRGAVIMWPKDRELDLVARMDVGYGAHVLKQSLKGQKKLDDEKRQSFIRLAHHILDSADYYLSKDISSELVKLGDIDLLKKSLFKRANSWSFDVEPVLFIRVAETFGWHHFVDDVESRLAAENGLAWLDSLLQTGKPISDNGRDVIAGWIESRWEESLTAAMRLVQAPAEPTTERERRRYVYTLQGFKDKKRGQQADIMYLVRLTACLNMPELSKKIIARLVDDSDSQFLTETYGPAVVEVLHDLKKREHSEAIAQHFADAIQQRIQAEFPAQPEPPQDWSRDGQLDCDCEFCAKVNEFLPKPDVSTTYIYGTLKRNLLHVESEIEKQNIEAEIEIRKTPPKFNGTISKNQSQYKRQLNLYQTAQSILNDLEDAT